MTWSLPLPSDDTCVTSTSTNECLANEVKLRQYVKAGTSLLQLKYLYNDLIKKSDVQRESKAIFEANLLSKLFAQLLRRGRRVGEQRLCVTVHKGYGQHERLLRLGSLQFEPARRLVTTAICKCSSQALLAVRRIARWSFFDEAAQVLDKLQLHATQRVRLTQPNATTVYVYSLRLGNK
jgi:hypothetical protein